MKLYSEYVKEKMAEMVKEAGSYRKLSAKIGVNCGYLNKVATGKLIPAPKTFCKWIDKDIITKLYIEED